MQNTHNAIDSTAEQTRESKDRLDDYAALAVRIYERLISEGKAPFPAPLTVDEASIRVEIERSKKLKSENTG